jgi:hypothetical protein
VSVVGPRNFKVTGIVSNDERPDKGHGPMRSIKLTFEGIAGTPEWYTKAETQPPAVGSELYGTVEDSQYGLKFKKAKQGGGGFGGPRPEDPERARRILRQHSQHMAIETLKLAQSLGVWPPKDAAISSVAEMAQYVERLADRFDKDVLAKGAV